MSLGYALWWYPLLPRSIWTRRWSFVRCIRPSVSQCKCDTLLPRRYSSSTFSEEIVDEENLFRVLDEEIRLLRERKPDVFVDRVGESVRSEIDGDALDFSISPLDLLGEEGRLPRVVFRARVEALIRFDGIGARNLISLSPILFVLGHETTEVPSRERLQEKWKKVDALVHRTRQATPVEKHLLESLSLLLGQMPLKIRQKFSLQVLNPRLGKLESMNSSEEREILLAEAVCLAERQVFENAFHSSPSISRASDSEIVEQEDNSKTKTSQ